jgi:hypothetical protein
MARKVVIWFMILLVPALAGCGSSQADTAAGAGGTAQATPGGFFGGGEMPLSMKLPAGTLMLEGTPNAVTPAQAKELLPLWQMFRALQGSTTTSQAEMDAVVEQIQGAMTKEQLAAIEGMSQEDMGALFQELGMGRQQEQNSGGTDQGGGRSISPPEGMMPRGGGEGPVIVGPGGGEGQPGGGEGGPGMGLGGFGNLSPEAQATAMAGRRGAGMGFGTGLTDAVIQLLEKRAAE